MPAVVAAIVAVLCTAVILVINYDPGGGSISSRDARMITSAAVARAGAIEIPSEPLAGRPTT